MFVTLKGRADATREYLALLSTTSEYCVIPRVDAYMLGYVEAISDTLTDMITRPNYVTTLASVNSFIDAPLITIKEVSIGRLAVKNLEFIAFDISQEARIDVILGRNFLERVKAKIDYYNKIIELEG
ncbi:MAG: hypothetical protein QXR26_04880 [Candidatus Caldarchaeum sp.]